MYFKEGISRRDFNKAAVAFIGGGIAFAAGCTEDKKPIEPLEVLPTPEPVLEWSSVEVPLNKAIYVPVTGLDKSPLGVSDLFVYSSSIEPAVFFGVVLKVPWNPRIPQVDFFLSTYNENFNFNDADIIYGSPNEGDISDKALDVAVNDILLNIPPNTDITYTRPIEVIAPVIKPAEPGEYVFTFKSNTPEYDLKGFIPVKFSFTASSKGVA